MEIIYGTTKDALTLAHKVHAGQGYGEFDYTRHLRDVAWRLAAAGYRGDQWEQAAWLHDAVEDTDLTIEAVSDQFGVEVAALVAAVTTPASVGNRKARLARLIELLTACPRALPLKLADRLANVHFCWLTRSDKLFMYHREYRRFRAGLRGLDDDERLVPMWADLDRMLGWWDGGA
jgi:(p)ppGpp synthase/HD superfamily hydrolase